MTAKKVTKSKQLGTLQKIKMQKWTPEKVELFNKMKFSNKVKEINEEIGIYQENWQNVVNKLAEEKMITLLKSLLPKGYKLVKSKLIK